MAVVPDEPLDYPARLPGVVSLGHRHFVLANGFGGFMWWHDCPAVAHVSWGWFGQGDGVASGHSVSHGPPLEVGGSLICRACGDHGWIRAGRWVPA